MQQELHATEHGVEHPANQGGQGRETSEAWPQQPRGARGWHWRFPQCQRRVSGWLLSGVGVGSGHHSEGGEDAEEPKDLGDLQRLLRAVPPLPAHPTAVATDIVAVARDDAPSLRDWLLTRAKKSGSCDCPQPRPRWGKDDPQATSTCGDENVGCAAKISMEGSGSPP